MSANTHESDHVAAVPLGVQQIDAFWSDFSDHLPRLAALEGAEFIEQANALLQPYAPELSIELEGRLKEPGGKLVFTAHGNIEQFENVQALVRNAPQGVSYGVQAFRNRTLNPEFSMGMQGFELSCTDVLVAHYDAGGILGLELSFGKDIPAEMQEHARGVSVTGRPPRRIYFTIRRSWQKYGQKLGFCVVCFTRCTGFEVLTCAYC